MSKERVIHLNYTVLKAILFAVADVIAVIASYFLGYMVEYGSIDLSSFIFVLGIVVFHILTFFVFKIYNILTDNIGMNDVIRIGVLILFINAIAIAFKYTVLPSVAELSVGLYIFIISLQGVIIIGVRCTQRVIGFYSISNKGYAITLIVGAGSSSKIAFDETRRNSEFHNKVVAFIDDDTNKIGQRYLGKPVHGPIKNIHKYIEKYKATEVIIAISKIDKEGLKRIVSILKNENVKVKRMPILSEQKDPTKRDVAKIREVSLAELLGRDQITFDTMQIANWLRGKRVLITGGGGSIGSELARQCYDFGVSELILFDIYENAVYDIQQELVRKIKANNSEMKLTTLIGSTYNEFRVEEIFAKYKPEVVFHAAAYKHVPLMEDSPVEAIRTNCLGTYNVAKMADKYNTEKVVLVSTDKAVRPTNTMGATKAFAEMVIRYWDNRSQNTSYSAVRFGNVLGSNGSVIPLFKKQISEGGPITVTHPDITRFFMTIPEAVSLILQSGAFATGGEIFILDMGQPVKILTLAENVIKQCGFIPYEDIDIVFTGLRPGEKLFEELLLDVTNHTKTSNEKIFIEEPKKILPMDEKLEYISKVFTMTDNDEIKNCLREIVTSYTDYIEFNAHNTNNK